MQSFNILYWTECLWIYIWMRDLWPNDWNIKKIYVEPKNVILERYILSTRKQKAGESLDQFLNELKTAKTVISKQYLLNNLNLKWLEMLLLVEYNPIISARDYSKIKLLICRQPLIKLTHWMLHNKIPLCFSTKYTRSDCSYTKGTIWEV